MCISRLLQEANPDSEKNIVIDLIPSHTATETTTTLFTVSLSSLLTNVGGAMGLWLGIGVWQLANIVIDAYDTVKYYYKNYV